MCTGPRPVTKNEWSVIQVQKHFHKEIQSLSFFLLSLWPLWSPSFSPLQTEKWVWQKYFAVLLILQENQQLSGCDAEWQAVLSITVGKWYSSWGILTPDFLQWAGNGPDVYFLSFKREDRNEIHMHKTETYTATYNTKTYLETWFSSFSNNLRKQTIKPLL